MIAVISRAQLCNKIKHVSNFPYLYPFIKKNMPKRSLDNVNKIPNVKVSSCSSMESRYWQIKIEHLALKLFRNFLIYLTVVMLTKLCCTTAGFFRCHLERCSNFCRRRKGEVV